MLSDKEIKDIIWAKHEYKLVSLEKSDDGWWKAVTKPLQITAYYEDSDESVEVDIGTYEIRVKTGKKPQIEFERLDGFFGSDFSADKPSGDIAHNREMGAFWVSIKTSERGNPVSQFLPNDGDEAAAICFGDSHSEVMESLKNDDALLPLDASLTIIDQEDDTGGLGNWAELSSEFRKKRGQLCAHCAKIPTRCVCKICEKGNHKFMRGCAKCGECRRHCSCPSVIKVDMKVRPRRDYIGEECKYGSTIEEDWAGIVTDIDDEQHKMWVRSYDGNRYVVDMDEFEPGAPRRMNAHMFDVSEEEQPTKLRPVRTYVEPPASVRAQFEFM